MVSPAGNGLSSVALLVFVLPRSFRFRDYHAGPVFHGTRLSSSCLSFPSWRYRYVAFEAAAGSRAGGRRATANRWMSPGV